jgi:hypothetical protein
MNDKIHNTTSSGNLTTHYDNFRHFSYATRNQSGSTMFLNQRSQEIGRIDSSGRTLDMHNHILSNEPRPDLLLGGSRH